MKGFCLKLAVLVSLALLLGSNAAASEAIIIDHKCTRIEAVPAEWIRAAKAKLHIAYGHTSHGSQLVTGMQGLVKFKGSLYSFNDGWKSGALDLRSPLMSGANYLMAGARDLGNPNRTAWVDATKRYLEQNPEINVVMWSWCGQVSNATEMNIRLYLSLMDQLEKDYPHVRFVYMTGHLDGTGLTGSLHIRNEQIRSFCLKNGKTLYDFADIETWNPDGAYFGDKRPDDGCYYDSSGAGSERRNWATEWQNLHPGKWYECTALHTQPLNANLKAYAAWWLWARLAGWNGKPAGKP